MTTRLKQVSALPAPADVTDRDLGKPHLVRATHDGLVTAIAYVAPVDDAKLGALTAGSDGQGRNGYSAAASGDRGHLTGYSGITRLDEILHTGSQHQLRMVVSDDSEIPQEGTPKLVYIREQGTTGDWWEITVRNGSDGTYDSAGYSGTRTLEAGKIYDVYIRPITQSTAIRIQTSSPATTNRYDFFPMSRTWSTVAEEDAQGQHAVIVRELVGSAPDALTEAQAEDSTSTVEGLISGLLLAAAVEAHESDDIIVPPSAATEYHAGTFAHIGDSLWFVHTAIGSPGVTASNLAAHANTVKISNNTLSASQAGDSTSTTSGSVTGEVLAAAVAAFASTAAAWDSSTAYKAGQGALHTSALWLALVDNTNAEPGTLAGREEWSLIRTGAEIEHAAGNYYTPGMVVKNGGNANVYLCRQPTSNEPSSASAQWFIMPRGGVIVALSADAQAVRSGSFVRDGNFIYFCHQTTPNVEAGDAEAASFLTRCSNPPELTAAQALNPASSVFGSVSGFRLSAAVAEYEIPSQGGAGIPKFVELPTDFQGTVIELTHDEIERSAVGAPRELVASRAGGLYGFSDGRGLPETFGTFEGPANPVSFIGSSTGTVVGGAITVFSIAQVGSHNEGFIDTIERIRISTGEIVLDAKRRSNGLWMRDLASSQSIAGTTVDINFKDAGGNFWWTDATTVLHRAGIYVWTGAAYQGFAFAPGADDADSSIAGTLNRAFIVTDIDVPDSEWAFVNFGDFGAERSGPWFRFLVADLTGRTVVAGTNLVDATGDNALMFPGLDTDRFYLGRTSAGKIAVAAQLATKLPANLRVRAA